MFMTKFVTNSIVSQYIHCHCTNNAIHNYAIVCLSRHDCRFRGWAKYFINITLPLAVFG